MAMTTSQEYEYQAYMSKGRSYESSGDSYYNSKDYLTAKDRYFSAASAYDDAERIANSAGAYSEAREASNASSNATSKARECPYKYDQLVKEQERSDPYSKNYSPWR